ncbi:MAG: glycosyltransferase family 2 protein [Candidatus Bathyarchaeota archaeon]|nr:glycosyltransferase family 2 protein [Candidatus Bathyarchaeota archaeon]
MAVNKFFPSVSIVILNWNGGDYVRKCVQSVLETDYPKELIEILVVDNGSTDKSADSIAKFGRIILIKNDKNYGYCIGNNIGVDNSSGQLIVLLNNDVMVDRAWLKDIVNKANDPEVGIVGCRLYYPETKIIQSIGFSKKWLGFWETVGSGYEDKGQFNKISEIDFVSGAALAIKRELVQKIGLFDPDFYAYCEDQDLCYRAKAAGYKVVTSQAKVYHYGSMSFSNFPIRKLYLTYRNTTLLIFKNYDMESVITYLLQFPFKTFIWDASKFLKKDSVLQKLDSKKGSPVRLFHEAIKMEALTISLFFVSLIPCLIKLPKLRKSYRKSITEQQR